MHMGAFYPAAENADRGRLILRGQMRVAEIPDGADGGGTEIVDEPLVFLGEIREECDCERKDRCGAI